MNDHEFQYSIECLSFEEKIKLAALEEGKARGRKLELEYEFSRYKLQWLIQMAQLAQKQAAAAQAQANAPQS